MSENQLQKRRKKASASKAPRADDFASVARRLGCDKDKSRFEKKSAKITKANPND